MKRSLILSIGLIIVLFLAACSPVATATDSNNSFNGLLEEGKMTFAMTGQYPPFNFINEDGDLAGFDIDIAYAIAEKIGLEASPITTEWDGIIVGLKAKRFDLIIGSMAITDARLEEVNFTNPYYFDGAQFFAPEGSELTDIADLEEGVVGVVTGTTFHEFIEDMDNIKSISQFQSDVDNMRSVVSGRTDGLITALMVGLYGAQQNNIGIEPIGEPLYIEEIGIAIRKEDTELLEAVNNALEEMMEDGTYQAISEKWFGRNMMDK